MEKCKEMALLSYQQKCILKKEKQKLKLQLQKVKGNLIKEQQKKLEIGIVIKQDILGNQAKEVFLAIGSNLGNRFKNIELTKTKLINNGIEILKISSYYETLSWPNNKHPKFINIVIKINTNLGPKNLLKTCKKIETLLGRKKSKKNSPRVCDIDILDYNQKKSNNGVNLPHPRLHKRNFVLIPLFEISKNWVHPKTKHHIKTLILNLPNKDITSIKQI